MEIVLSLLCGLSIFLLFVAVVGHALWVAAAWLLSKGSNAAETGRPCPRCGARYGVREGRCLNCGAVPYVAPGSTSHRDELTTTARQLARFRENGLITQQQYDDLTRVIAAELGAPMPPPVPAERIPTLVPRSADAHSSPQPVAPPSPPVMVTLPPSAPAPALHASPASEPEVIEAILVEPPASPVHPLDRPDVPLPPKPSVKPARPLADVLQSFMEESNIRWGEILAATLIVLCSVGLVISLRNTLKNIPYFPAILFTLFTVAFHGAGMYTLRRWNLAAVSRVILIISLLLVPLTFSAAVVMSGSGEQQRPPTDPLFLIALATGIAVFTWVCYSAGRELIGRGAWPLTIAVLGCSLSQVLIQRVQLTGADFVRLAAVAALPIGAFLVATGWQVIRARRWQQLSERRIVQILLLLGIATFALLAPLALILVRGEPRWTILARLSPQLSIAAAAILALGLLIHRRTIAKRLSAWQTAGTAIVVFGGALLVMLVGFAWPEPELLLAIGLINCVILAMLGVVSGLPLLYIPAVACAALATTIGLHLMGGHFKEREQLTLKVVQALLMGRTSLALTVLGSVIVGIGAWLAGRRRADDATMLLASTAGLAAIAILIALFSGFIPVESWPQDRDLAPVILLLYAVVLLAIGPLTRWLPIAERLHLADTPQPKLDDQLWPVVASAGSLLLWTAIVHALLLNSVTRAWLESIHALPTRPILVSTLVHGVVAALLAAAATGRGLAAGVSEFQTLQSSRRFRLFAKPLAIAAATSLMTIVPFIIAVRGDQFSANAALAAWAAAAWVALAASQRWQWAISGVQAMSSLAAALVIAGVWKSSLGSPTWIVAEQHLLAQLIAAAIGVMVWSAIRRLTSHREVAARLVPRPLARRRSGPARHRRNRLAIRGDDGGHASCRLGTGIQRRAIATPARPRRCNRPARPRLDRPCRRRGSAGRVPLGTRLLPCGCRRRSRHVGSRLARRAALRNSDLSRLGRPLGRCHLCPCLGRSLYCPRSTSGGGQTTLLAPLEPLSARSRTLVLRQPLILGGATILIITIIAVNQNASGVALRGPAAGAIFHRIGATASYAGPLFALVAVLLGYAVRDRQSGFALGGAAVSQLAINLAFLLYVSTSPTQPASVRTIEWLQWNSVAAGLYSLVWLGLSRWITPTTASEPTRQIADALWAIPVAIAGITATALVVWAAWIIADQPGAPPAEIGRLGNWLSYLAVALVLTAVIARARGRLEMRGLGDAAAWLAAGLAVLVATTLHRYDTGGQWVAYHALEAGWLLVSAAACGLRRAGVPGNGRYPMPKPSQNESA